MSGPNAAERYAALTALRAGLDAQIAKAKTEALAFSAEHGVKAFTTPYGPVNVTVQGPRPVIDGPAFTAWCQENRPDEVVMTPTVRGSFVTHMADRLVVVAGSVYDKETGDLVPWAYVGEAGDPTLAYPASTDQKYAKDLARLLFEDRAEALTAGLRELTGEVTR